MLHDLLSLFILTLIKVSEKAINALFSLKGATPTPLIDEPLGYSPTGRPSDLYDVPQSAILHRGQQFFEKVYGKVSKRVMSQMDRSGTESVMFSDLTFHILVHVGGRRLIPFPEICLLIRELSFTRRTNFQIIQRSGNKRSVDVRIHTE